MNKQIGDQPRRALCDPWVGLLLVLRKPQVLMGFPKPITVEAMAFPVVMYGCEKWTIKKVEHQRIDAIELCS